MTVRGARQGFTLVELITCIGIVAVLGALLVPLGNKAIKNAQSAQCSVNLRKWGQVIRLYQAENDGNIAVVDASSGQSWGASPDGPYITYFGDTVVVRSQQIRKARACSGHKQVAGEGTMTYAMAWPAFRESSPSEKLPPRHQIPLNAATQPSHLLLMMDAPPNNGFARYGFEGIQGWSGASSQGPASDGVVTFEQLASAPWPRHPGGINVLFADGHVRKCHWEARSPDDPDSFVVQQRKWFVLNPEPGD